VLIAASVQFASTLEHLTYCEFPTTGSPLITDILDEPLLPEDGKIAVPTGPGLGVELDERVLERYRIS
jgi:L-rhamnonate dehydratase